MRVKPDTIAESAPCATCGGVSVQCFGSVVADDDRADYEIRWSAGRPEHDAGVLVQLRDQSGSRVAVALRIYFASGQLHLQIEDATLPPFSDFRVPDATRLDGQAWRGRGVGKRAMAVVEALVRQHHDTNAFVLEGLALSQNAAFQRVVHRCPS